MLTITRKLANDILELIKNQIKKAQIITDQASRTVIITSKVITDNTESQELILNIELYRNDNVSEILQEIQLYDVQDNLLLKSTNLNIELPSAKIIFVYQIRLAYRQ